MNRLLFACLLMIVIGCGGSAPDNATQVTVPPAEQELKTMLTKLSESGASVGSGAIVVSELIEKIKKTDQAKGDKLVPLADNLMGASDPAKVKQISGEMLKVLQ